MSDNVNTSAATQEPVFVSPSDLSVNFTKNRWCSSACKTPWP